MNSVSLLHVLPTHIGLSIRVHCISKSFPIQASEIASSSLTSRSATCKVNPSWNESFWKTEMGPEGGQRSNNKFRTNGGMRTNLSGLQTDWFIIQLKIFLTTQFIFFLIMFTFSKIQRRMFLLALKNKLNLIYRWKYSLLAKKQLPIWYSAVTRTTLQQRRQPVCILIK
jgi:hypothetical protein